MPLEDRQSIDSVTVVLTFPPNEFNSKMFLLYTVLFYIMLYMVVITVENVNQMLTVNIQIKVTEYNTLYKFSEMQIVTFKQPIHLKLLRKYQGAT